MISSEASQTGSSVSSFAEPKSSGVGRERGDISPDQVANKAYPSAVVSTAGQLTVDRSICALIDCPPSASQPRDSANESIAPKPSNHTAVSGTVALIHVAEIIAVSSAR